MRDCPKAYVPAEIEAAVEADSSWYLEKGQGATITLRGESVAIEAVDTFGGEGQGDDIWVVVRVGDQLFKKSGYYASHYGTDWDGDVTEVKPVQKTITVYEDV